MSTIDTIGAVYGRIAEYQRLHQPTQTQYRQRHREVDMLIGNEVEKERRPCIVVLFVFLDRGNISSLSNTIILPLDHREPSRSTATDRYHRRDRSYSSPHDVLEHCATIKRTFCATYYYVSVSTSRASIPA